MTRFYVSLHFFAFLRLDQALDQLDEIRDRIQGDSKPVTGTTVHDLNASKIEYLFFRIFF